MKKPIQFICAIIASQSVGTAQPWPEAAVTVLVRSEEGVPMFNVSASVTFDQPRLRTGTWGSSAVLSRDGKTNDIGAFYAAAASGNYVNTGANAPGYYTGHGTPVEFSKSENGKWQPWNPTVNVILKKIVKPIPMYARHVEVQLPAIDAPGGFDLVECDWVSPN